MSAKEMFEELGYKLDEYFYVDSFGYNNLVYRHKDNKYQTISFTLDIKEIIPYLVITMEELQAINKQIEELRWNK